MTDYWAVLSPHMEHHNATCDAAHFGLWRICTKRIVMSDNKDKSCGPITLPGGNVLTLCALSLPPALPRPPGKVARGKEGRSASLGTGPLPSPLGRGKRIGIACGCNCKGGHLSLAISLLLRLGAFHSEQRARVVGQEAQERNRGSTILGASDPSRSHSSGCAQLHSLPSHTCWVALCAQLACPFPSLQTGV